MGVKQDAAAARCWGTRPCWRTAVQQATCPSSVPSSWRPALRPAPQPSPRCAAPAAAPCAAVPCASSPPAAAPSEVGTRPAEAEGSRALHHHHQLHRPQQIRHLRRQRAAERWAAECSGEPGHLSRQHAARAQASRPDKRVPQAQAQAHARSGRRWCRHAGTRHIMQALQAGAVPGLPG